MTGRDIKPDNIMLDKWLTLKIGDFGFARAGHQEKGFKSILVCLTFGPVDERVLLLFEIYVRVNRQTDRQVVSKAW
jgi:serine/threonine protein kinase